MSAVIENLWHYFFSAFLVMLVRRLTAFPAVAFERVDIAADFRRRAGEVEIVLIEAGDLLQPSISSRVRR